VGTAEGKRRLEDNIKMDLQELGCGGYGLDRAGWGLLTGGGHVNKQSRTADEGWSSSLRVGRGANNASP